MIVLIHTSKTMRPIQKTDTVYETPLFLEKSKHLGSYLKTLTPAQIAKTMSIKGKLAQKTYDLTQSWTDDGLLQNPSVDSFVGDIYSGLQVHTWTDSDRQYANTHLRILSGLYGILRPLDGIFPYRLELGYKLPDEPYRNLYKYWGSSIAETLPENMPIINLAAVEYSKIITPYVDSSRVISPSFLTVSPKTGVPTFVTVHTKIARGAFASWMIKNQIENITELKNFQDLGYKFDQALSSEKTPVFVCREFGGLGLSVRLTR